MKRFDCLKALAAAVRCDDLVVTNLGNTMHAAADAQAFARQLVQHGISASARRRRWGRRLLAAPGASSRSTATAICS